MISHLKRKHDYNPDAEEVPAKKVKPEQQQQPSIRTYVKKESADEMIAREAAFHGASFRYLTESPLIKNGLLSHGYSQSKSVTTIGNMVNRCAESKKDITKAKIQSICGADGKFSATLYMMTKKKPLYRNSIQKSCIVTKGV